MEKCLKNGCWKMVQSNSNFFKFIDLGGVRAQTGLGGESFAANIAVEGTVLGSLHLGIVVPQMLL